jgi:putative hemolysin
MSELAIVSSRPSSLKVMMENDAPGARHALALASDPGKFLSSVQIGITLVGIVSGVFSGATLGVRFSNWIEISGVPGDVAEVLGYGLVVAAITYASLVIGELVPKQIALRNPEAVAVRVAPAMSLLAKMTSPVVWVLDQTGKVLLYMLGQQGQNEKKITQEEIKTIIAEAETAGVLEPEEKQMITGVMRLGDRPVHVVMIPRHEVDMLDLSAPPSAWRATLLRSRHYRFPVYDGNPDAILGVVNAKDMLDAFVVGTEPDLRDLIRQVPVIPDTSDVVDALAILKESRIHMGLVHDEYGVFRGVLTSGDVLESIVGTFRTDQIQTEVSFTRREDGSYLIAGSMLVDELDDLLGISLPKNRIYPTVAGFALEHFGALPAVGDFFHAHGWRFEVVDLDERRIDKVLAAQSPALRRANR